MIQHIQRIPLQVLGQLVELDPSAKSLIDSYFTYCPEYAALIGIKNTSAKVQYRDIPHSSLHQLTLQDLLEIQEMEEMPLPLLEEYNIFMFNECSLMMKQYVEEMFLPEVDYCLNEFQEYDVLYY